MNEKTLKVLKITTAFLVGIWAVIWFGANKIGASITLAVIVFIIMLPFSKRKWVTYARILFVVTAFVFVFINISTTDLPPNAHLTNVKFIDQVIHIFNGFVRHVTQ